MKKGRKIQLARHAGFCFGVRRAIRIAEESLAQKNIPIFCWGELIHNSHVVKDLEKKGLRVIENLKTIPPNSFLIIRSHGVAPEIFHEAKKRGITIIDATCPFVQKAQVIAKDFYQKNYQVIIIGDKKHPEVIGIRANTKNTALIVNGETEANKLKKFPQIGLLIQTTGETELLKKVEAILRKKTKKLKVANTICLNSFSKKEEIKVMAEDIDILLVIGDRKSNNTKKLVEVGLVCGIKTYQIESAKEIKSVWLRGKTRIGLTAGASTPDILIQQVEDKVKKL
ncbi:4-hydroxy-3-methylbut-2-enyl diphosphate reductase [Patescibacteria group bacterium]|nr:4-hydroxy-3-methylbut-2-enyl diphosphate reductase [Patescibacteria group bacterium]